MPRYFDDDAYLRGDSREGPRLYLKFFQPYGTLLSSCTIDTEFRGGSLSARVAEKPIKQAIPAPKEDAEWLAAADAEKEILRHANARERLATITRIREQRQQREQKIRLAEEQRRLHDEAQQRRNDSVMKNRLHVLQELSSPYRDKPACFARMHDADEPDCVGSLAKEACLLEVDCGRLQAAAPPCFASQFSEYSADCLGTPTKERERHCALAGLCAIKSGHFPG